MRGTVRPVTRARQAAAGIALLMLVACSSPIRLNDVRGPAASPSPSPQSVPTPTPAPAPAPAPAVPQLPPPRPEAPSLSLPSPAAARPAVATPPVPPGPDVPPQIAANFPEPRVTFATPAFENGRTAFTTNDELRAVLLGLSRSGGRGPQDTDISVLPLGAAQSGTPIEALVFTRAVPDAAAASMPPATSIATAGAASTLPTPRRPAVLLIAGQHGDEPAGTEALIIVAQAIAAGRFDKVLDQVDIYLVPRANPDGAARGRRDADDGSDLNRDHILLRTPEAAALAQLVRDVAPLVALDLHEYAVDAGFVARFGAVQRYDALLQYATVGNEPAFFTKAAEEWFRLPMMTSLASNGLAAEWYYTVSEDVADKKLTMGGVGAEIGRNAQGLKNSVSLLLETRGRGIGRTDLKRRVQANVVVVGSVLASAGARAGDLVKLRQFVERDLVAQACRGEAVLDAAPTPSEKMIAMIDAQTGAVRRVSVSWDSALELRVLKSRPRPCGYWLAAAESDSVRRLRLLGVEVQQVDEAGEVRGETYRETGFQAATASVDGLARLRVQTQSALLDIAAGSYFVSLEQPLANIAVAALEPESPYGFAANRVIGDVRGEARVLGRPGMRMIVVP